LLNGKLVRPKSDTVGWFGYCQYEKSTLDVWFYSGTEKAASRVKELLEKHSSRTKVKIDEKINPHISLPAEKSPDNQDWFVSVFESLVHCQ